MRSEMSSLVSSNPTPLPRFLSRPANTIGFPSSSSLYRDGFKKKQRSRSASARASHGWNPPPVPAAGSPEPPWPVLPPPPPENPFSADARPSDLQLRGVSGTGIPFSLRLLQMKKRLAADQNRTESSPPPAEECPAGKAVSALLFMMGELQRAVFSGNGGVEEGVLDRVSRVRRETFLWLFRRVFFSSPNLLVPLLVLLANFLAFSAEKSATTTTSAAAEKSETPAAAATAATVVQEAMVVEGEDAVEIESSMKGSAIETIGIGENQNWFDIGIDEGHLNRRQQEETPVDRRRRAYERAIAEGGGNSLILSNYAQFLHRVANDHDRAEQYFRWAVLAEPRDAEAMSQYAFFLWEGRGDVAGAEERFLEAIDAEPGSYYHSSNYASFLWETGAVDTCFPLDPPHHDS